MLAISRGHRSGPRVVVPRRRSVTFSPVRLAALVVKLSRISHFERTRSRISWKCSSSNAGAPVLGARTWAWEKAGPAFVEVTVIWTFYDFIKVHVPGRSILFLLAPSQFQREDSSFS